MREHYLIVTAVVIGLAIIYGLFLFVRVVLPLRKMKKTAERFREGNFEKLEGSGGSRSYGMFSAGFNTMCDELNKSREREIALKNNEMEVYASLARELSDPLKGIKLNAELLRTKLLTEKGADADGYVLDKLENIYNRADQMGVVLDSLLSTALDGFGEFMVSCADTDSLALEDMLKKNDYRHLVSITNIPHVLIHIDESRMRQVIKCIIENSYRYANTQIDVGFLLTDDYLQMKIADHGGGVAEDEIGLITDRFYRSRKWADSSEEGSGLGLYIAKTLMENMDGHLGVANTGDGLCVTLLIKLS